MRTNLAMAGVRQGDMSAHVEDFSKPTTDFSQEGFSQTLDYVERQDMFQAREAMELRKQDYKGRYN